MNGQTRFHYYLSIGARKGDVIAVMIENRSELIATIVGLAKIGVTIALVNTSQVGKVLAHSINLVKPIAVIAGEEVRAAIDEIRQDLNIPKDRFHWFADQATRQNAGKAPQGYANLAEQIDQFPKFNPSTTRSVTGNDGLFYIYTWYNRFAKGCYFQAQSLDISVWHLWSYLKLRPR